MEFGRRASRSAPHCRQYAASLNRTTSSTSPERESELTWKHTAVQSARSCWAIAITSIERNVTDKPLRRLTASTITNPAALAQDLRTVRGRMRVHAGDAVSEVHCVGAPVRDDMGVSATPLPSDLVSRPWRPLPI